MLTVTGVVSADDSEISALREQLKALSQQVEVLQGKLNAREQKEQIQATTPANQARSEEAASTKTEQAGTTVVQNWRKITPGLTQDQVLQLLGEPAAKFRAGGQTVWYYKYPGKGVGSVFFYDNGRAASSQRPPIGSWW
jgi:hypothetical protein